jgi:hypothetical protein
MELQLLTDLHGHMHFNGQSFSYACKFRRGDDSCYFYSCKKIEGLKTNRVKTNLLQIMNY